MTESDRQCGKIRRASLLTFRLGIPFQNSIVHGSCSAKPVSLGDIMQKPILRLAGRISPTDPLPDFSILSILALRQQQKRVCAGREKNRGQDVSGTDDDEAGNDE